MRVRKLGVLVAAALVAVGLFVTPTPAQAAPVPVSVCVVAGIVNLSPGADVTIPPTSGPVQSYDFASVFLVCAGNTSGVCNTTSEGSTEGRAGTSGFSGTFDASCIGTGHECNGGIGGASLHENNLPNTSFPDYSWSFSGGPLLLASLQDVECETAVLPYSGGRGVFAAVAAPIPNGSVDVGPPVSVGYDQIVIAGVAVLTIPVP